MHAGDQVGPYELLRRIGEGGMGVVWEAHDTRLGRGVALKFLTETMVDDAESRARFEREARSVSALTHPNICVLYDIGDYGGRPYLVMELLAGRNLKERLADGPLEEADLLRLARHVAAALGAAHDRGILHRDLKPANLFLTDAGAAKILDFGVAKAVSAEPDEATELTSAGTLLGTVKYMSPEQALGRAIDGRSDLFSLGAVLYQAATDRPPFEEPTVAATLNAVVNHEPRPLSELAPAISAETTELIARLLSKSPADRFATAAHLTDALDRIRLSRSVSGTASGVSPAPTMAAPPEAAPSIAVLPFANLSPDPDNAFFTDGLAEELITSLSRLPGLRVAARSSAFQFKGGAVDARDAGRQLGVAAVLEGSVRRAGDRVRVTAQLVDVDTGYQKWSERFDGTLDDIFAIQEETAAAIVDGLQLQLGTSGPQVVMRHHTDNRQAYELYLKGRFHWARRHKGGFQIALDCFQRAAALDPGYALAWVGVADVYWSMIVYAVVPYADSWERAEAAVVKALELDPELAEAHATKAVLKMFRFDWESAERHFRKSIDLDPNYWVGPAYFGLMLALQLRVEEAYAMGGRAVFLEPDSHFAWAVAGLVCQFADEPEASLEFYDRAIELEPEAAMGWMFRGLARSETGQHEEAIADVLRGVDLSNRMVFMAGVAALVAGRCGRMDLLEALEQELERRAAVEHVSDVARYLIAGGRGDDEGASRLLMADIAAGGAGWQCVVMSRSVPAVLEHMGLPRRG